MLTGRTRIWLVLIFIMLGLLTLSSFCPRGAQPEEISYPQFQKEVLAGNIEPPVLIEVTSTGSIISGKFKERIRERIKGKEKFTTFTAHEDLYSFLEEQRLEYKEKPYSSSSWWLILLNILPLLFIGILFFWLILGTQRGVDRSFNLGKVRKDVRVERPNVTFSDVAGVKEAKEELQEVVAYLKFQTKYLAMGAKIPKGVLLSGPPGTGKTLLARAVAGEAQVPFFSISGSEFVEMFVGVGAARVRDLFGQAKSHAPSIVFIDEIDAIGRHRGAGLGGGHDEREQTLNQIFVEMDGFDERTNIIVIAATNRPDILDPALLRPGRFDVKVIVDNPDMAGRKAILEVHAKGKPFTEDVDLEVLAKQTAGFSGADLANVINEAAILAVRREKKVISMEELNEGVDRTIAGPERKSMIISPKEKEIIAMHETGHALASWLIPEAERVYKITAIPRGLAGGYTRFLPEDRVVLTKPQLEAQLAVLLAGRVAEEMKYGEAFSTGASDDLGKATKLARQMATEYGMSEKLGHRTFGRKEGLVFLGREAIEERDYSEETARIIDGEVDSFLRQAHQRAKKILRENRDKLEEVARVLAEEEKLEGERLQKLLGEKAQEKARD